MAPLKRIGAFWYRTVVTETRRYQLPGDQRRSYETLWKLLKRLDSRRKVDGVGLRAFDDGKAAITLKVYDDDKYAKPLWHEIERCLGHLREDARNQEW